MDYDRGDLFDTDFDTVEPWEDDLYEFGLNEAFEDAQYEREDFGFFGDEALCGE